jgi:hypothetical protein
MMVNESLGTVTVNVRSLQPTDSNSGKQLNIKISKTPQTQRGRSQYQKTFNGSRHNSVL